MRTGVTLLWLSFVAACLHEASVTCGDGTVCPAGLECGGEVGGCIDGQLCRTAPDGTACGAKGACFGGACMLAACGNGRVERAETCDDGNFLSHDGCSSTCVAESPRWSAVVPPQQPLPYAGTALTYDRLHGRILLFGGAHGTFVNDTWSWDGMTWTRLTPASSPSPRFQAATAYDDAGQRLLLFGGADPTMEYADTWSWDGTTWTQVAMTNPPARKFHRIAFDPILRGVMLFGGLGPTDLGDTWTWNGAQWAQASPPTSPAARYGFALATDRTNRRVVGFGGVDDLMFDNDTWAWDGANWTNLGVPPGPGPRWNSAFAFIEGSPRAIMFGGIDLTGTILTDTWELDGNAWHMIAIAPFPAIVARFAYDPLHEELVLVGVDGVVSTFQMWTFRYEYPGEPDESCVAGEDADGDGLRGCDDPDCWGYCTPLCPPGATDCDPNAPHCGDGRCNMVLETSACPQDCP